MNPNQKRLLVSIINAITIFTMIVTMTVPVSFFASTVNAQDATQEPVAEPTATQPAPTEAPTAEPIVATETAAPTEGTPDATVVTEQPTEEATAIVTEAPTAEATSVVTDEPTAAPTSLPPLFQDDFQDGDVVGWQLSPDLTWQIVSEADGNLFLSTANPNATAAITAISPADFAFTARVRVAADNKALIAFRAGSEQYTLTLDLASNNATLSRGETILGQIALPPPATDESGQPVLEWHGVAITAAGSSIAVAIDELPAIVYVDATPLSAGAILFSSDASNSGSITIDDVVINQVDPGLVTPTAVPIEEITPEVTETAAPTEEATPESTPEIIGQVVLSADFESELIGWATSEGATVVAQNDVNHALLLSPSMNFIPAEPVYLSDLRLDARVYIANAPQEAVTEEAQPAAKGINIAFRTQNQRTYAISFEEGQTVLSRNDGDGLGLKPLASSPTVHGLDAWHNVSLDARGGHLLVTVNGVVEIDITEADPLLNGEIAFVANAVSSVMLDDITVTDFSGNVLMSATAEPMGLSEAEIAKLPPSLLDVMDLFLQGDEAGAFAQAQANFVPMDEQGRIQVVVWAVEGETGTTLASLVETIGGVNNYVYDRNAEAHVPLAGIVALANAPQIAAIDLASLATSTGLAGAPAADVQAAPAGTVASEGFDIISANDWHQAGLMGSATHKILLVDTSFAGLASVPADEKSCASVSAGVVTTGTGGHGVNVVQVLCDVVPAAGSVRVATATDASSLNSIIAVAAEPIILITMDLGVNVSSGDGTGAGSTAASTLYATLDTLKNNATKGKLVIVSSGNNNHWAADTSCVRFDLTCLVDGDPFTDGNRIGRYFSRGYAQDAAAISIPAVVYPGDIIRVSWNDWGGTGSREDFTIGISGDFTQVINTAVASRPQQDPGEAYTIAIGDCPAASAPCTVNINLGGPGAASFGDSSVLFQIQISGKGLMNRSGITGGTAADNAGNLARPADSPNVMAVGAVCARAALNYPLLRESSIGPIFATGGAAVGSAGTTPALIKPQLVGPADVSVVGNVITDASADGCRDGETDGFSGTSAAAAYVAAQAALIRSNTNPEINPVTPVQTVVQKRDRMVNYLLSHTVDLFAGAEPDGAADSFYGAGLAVLGNPDPDYPLSEAGSEVTDPTCSGGIRYVSPANASTASFSGQGTTLANPYRYPSEALAEAPANSCVILLPGEYVGGIYASSGVASGVRMQSYDSALAGVNSSSIIWTNNGFNNIPGSGDSAGIFITQTNLSIDGFVFKQANPLNLPGAVVFPRPYSMMLNQASGNTISNNLISGYKGTTTTTFASAFFIFSSQNVTVSNNVFSDNIGDSGAAINVISSGTSTPITIQRNFFVNNASTTSPNFAFPPTIKVDASEVNIYNNRFNTNSTKSLILVADQVSTVNVPDPVPAGPEVQVFGNAFTRNTNSGPIVHLYPGRHFRFINNTVAGNKSISTGDRSAIILRGDGSTASGDGGNGLIDIHNNVFYDNNAVSLVKDLGGQFLCVSNDGPGPGNTENGAQTNWAFGSGSASGVCELSLVPALGNDVNNTNPGDPIANPDASQFVGAIIAPDDPYQMKAVAFGIDIADETLINNANPTLIAGVDALGKQRHNSNVDLGAYEFKPVTAGPTGTIARAEDIIETTSPIPGGLGTITPTPTKPVIFIPLYASGGFGSYTFEIVSGPQNYSTDITNSCGGQPVFYDPSFYDEATGKGRALFCPPRHFYNVGISDPAAPVTFKYRVRDGAGNYSVPDTVTVTLTATADKALVTSQSFSSVSILTEPPTLINVRLRPYARFGNFRLAAPGDPLLLPPDSPFPPNGLEAQYPYTFVADTAAFAGQPGFPIPGAAEAATTCGDDFNPQLFGASEAINRTNVGNAFNAAASSGVMSLTPITGQTGCFDFSYTARDAGSSQSTGNIMRIVVVGSLPDEGLHDDTSFSFDYRGTTEADVGKWSPIYNEGTINNTLHQSIGLDDTAEFLFDGVGFALYMQGSTLGGPFEVKVENGGVPVTLAWTAVPNVVGQLQSTVGGLTCRTSATGVAGQPSRLTNYNSNQPYVVSCSGLLDGEANKVLVINKLAGKQVNVDAIGILTDIEPLQPGVHEVTEAQLLPTFFTGWTRENVTAAVGQKAVSTSSISSDFTFRFQGTGFALGTALQKTALPVTAQSPLGVRYKVCVAETITPTNRICQNFDNGVGATTALTWKTYRPFFGFDPTKTYDVSVDITAVPNYSGAGAAAVKMKLYIDSIVVYNQKPTATLSNGITEDDKLGPIVFGGGLDDTWTFNTNNTLASNKSLTSIVTTVPKVGPFINFLIPIGADTINWFQNGATNTTKALVCVDRPEFDVAPSEFGNCITINTRTGDYFQISNTGQEQADPSLEAKSANPLIISEGMFREPWSAGQPHNIEISSLTNEAFNLDKIQVFDSDGPLTAGYYEENVRNLRWFTENELITPTTNDYVLLQPGDFGNFTEVKIASASGGKLRQLSADSVAGIPLDTNNLYEGMFFQFNGTGFSVSFRLDTKADAVRICWLNDGGSPATPSESLIETVLTANTCQTYDNQSTIARYKAARTIAGLTASNYSVAVQMLPDQGEPAAHVASALPITMAIDAVQIYNDVLPTNPLNVSGTRYETSFTNRIADGRFIYLGSGWKSVTGTAANLYSGKNYDSILNVIGAGVVFQTNSAANVIIYRDTRTGFAPMQVCVTDQAPVQSRCTIIANNGGSGYQQPIVVPLFDATPHTVSIMTTDAGTFNLDAIAVSNTPLQPGIYDENNPALVYSTTSNVPIPVTGEKPIYSHWKDIIGTSYQDGGAMQSQLVATDHASVTFQFVGTGFSLITQFDSLSGSLEADIDGVNHDYVNIPLNNYNAAVVYKSSHSITGLPQDTYTVTITENDASTPPKRRFTVDGVEIYGNYDAARVLTPGFYDNAATNSAGNPYLLYGPSNLVWTAKTGTTAATSLNQTNHTATRFGAQVTFEVQNANAITLFHSGSTSTAVRVCAVLISSGAWTCDVATTLVGKSNTTFTAPFTGGVGNYYVSITNLKHSLSLIVDAVSVFNTATLTQGIYQDNTPNPALKFTGPSWLPGSTAETIATDKFVKSSGTGNPGDQLEFTFTGTGFSIVLVESTATSQNYRLCVKAGTTGGCPGVVIGAGGGGALTPVGATATKRPVALTYVGLASGQYTVTLINDDLTKPLLVDRVDILGTVSIIGDTITGNIENTDPRITYFPFFTFNPVANVAASGGTQHTGAMQGSVVYFEINNAAGSLDFDYVRQTLATYGSVQVCSGAIGTVSSSTVPACTLPETLIETIANTGPLPVGYQKVEPVSIAATGNRWVILRNENGKIMPFDFIRPTIAGAPLTAGHYEETHPNIRWFTENDAVAGTTDGIDLRPSGDFANFTNLAVASASGGTVRVLNEDSDLVTLPVSNDKKNLYEGVAFQFFGTGFSTLLTLDTKADAVKICWTNDGGSPVTFNSAKVTSVLTAGTCQIVAADAAHNNPSYDNQSTVIRYKAARTILGLVQSNYTVAVQMLDDNEKPVIHTAATTPLTMQIDAVQIHNDVLPTTVLNDLTKRYETSYVNRATDKTFLYYGAGWTSFSGTSYKSYSGSNYDKITGVVGAGVVFQTNNANSIILYRQTAAGYTPLEVCATAGVARTCTIVQNNGSSGYQQAVSIPLNPVIGTQVVSIVTLDGGIFALDAIQIANSNAPLAAGLYEDTYPGLKFTNNGGTPSGAWTTVFGTTYSGGSARQTNVPGASGDVMTFTFTGTGFEIGTGIDRYGGEMQVCYEKINAPVGPLKCYLYQNEFATISNLVSRTVTGLASGTYDVTVRHADDGNQITAPVGTRIATYSPSRLRIDYVRIFDNVLSALPPTVTQSGVYNEDATNGVMPYLQFLPTERWGSFSGTAAKAFSNSSYVGVVNTTKVLAATYAGPSATLRIEVPTGGATVILYTGVAITTNTNRLLVCADDVTGTDVTPIPVPVDCNIVTDMRTANQIILSSTNLPALANAGATKTISLTFRALTPGLFRVDGFQVIRGTTLTAGIYDDFLAGPTNVLATTGTWDFAPSTLSKLAAAYGGTQALARTTGATMTFNFQGSGFGVLTTVDSLGVDMRLCYKLSGSPTAFPPSTTLNVVGKATNDVTCHTYTTDTSTVITDWSAKNGNIPRPTLGYSYGFDIHGLVNNTYTAEIRLVRPAVATPPTLPVALAATDRLKIDAIAIFSDITAGGTLLTSAPSGQYYDDAAAGIRYEPTPFWTSTTTKTGPTTGPWNLTEHTSTRAGAIVQFNMNGNGFILYQSAKTTNSKYVRVCVRTNLGQECSEFSQNAALKYFSPIAIYGLGTALNHEIVIENRDYGRSLSIDGLKIIP